MARTNFSPGRDSRTGKGGITSLTQDPSRIPLGFEYKLRFNYKIPQHVMRGPKFTFKEVFGKL